MKKLWIILLLTLALSIPALAESAPEKTTPEPTNGPADTLSPRAKAPSDSAITLDLDGERIELPFDDSPQYSSVDNGVVQASFYAYSPDGSLLYELYIVFPESVRPGDVVTPQYALQTSEETSVVLIVSDVKSEQELYYMAGIMGGSPYPERSDFSISIQGVEPAQGGTAYSGSLSAELVALDISSGSVIDALSISDAAFSFTIGGAPQERHTAEPLPTALPSDMRKV